MLSQELGCPIVKTVSTSKQGLKELIETAITRANQQQTAPFRQDEIDVTDKSEVERADRKRFEFVNQIVKKVETRKSLTKETNINDKIDAILYKQIG